MTEHPLESPDARADLLRVKPDDQAADTCSGTASAGGVATHPDPRGVTMRLDELTPLDAPGWDDRVRSHVLARLAPGDSPAAEVVAELVEHHRLQVLFPDRYVLFRDRWQDAGAVRVLVKREVFFTSADLSEAQDFLDSVAPEERDQVELQFIDP